SQRERRLHGRTTNGEPRTPSFSDRWEWSEEAFESLSVVGLSAELRYLLQALVDSRARDSLAAYLVMMAPRLLQCRRVLAGTGSLYLHCDPTASHYLKLLLDAMFGAECFRREIVWRSGWISGFKTRTNNWARN